MAMRINKTAFRTLIAAAASKRHEAHLAVLDVARKAMDHWAEYGEHVYLNMVLAILSAAERSKFVNWAGAMSKASDGEKKSMIRPIIADATNERQERVAGQVCFVHSDGHSTADRVALIGGSGWNENDNPVESRPWYVSDALPHQYQTAADIIAAEERRAAGVKKYAEENDISLDEVRGTGIAGEVTRKDVKLAIEAKAGSGASGNGGGGTGGSESSPTDMTILFNALVASIKARDGSSKIGNCAADLMKVAYHEAGMQFEPALYDMFSGAIREKVAEIQPPLSMPGGSISVPNAANMPEADGGDVPAEMPAVV